MYFFSFFSFPDSVTVSNYRGGGRAIRFEAGTDGGRFGCLARFCCCHELWSANENGPLRLATRLFAASNTVTECGPRFRAVITGVGVTWQWLWAVGCGRRRRAARQGRSSEWVACLRTQGNNLRPKEDIPPFSPIYSAVWVFSSARLHLCMRMAS